MLSPSLLTVDNGLCAAGQCRSCRGYIPLETSVGNIASVDSVEQPQLRFEGQHCEGASEEVVQFTQVSAEAVNSILNSGTAFWEKDGMLYRKVTDPHGELYIQLLLPSSCLQQEL